MFSFNNQVDKKYHKTETVKDVPGRGRPKITNADQDSAVVQIHVDQPLQAAAASRTARDFGVCIIWHCGPTTKSTKSGV